MYKLLLIAAVTLLAAGCDINDRENRVETRALQSPYETNSSENEMRSDVNGVPLVSGDLPNKPGDPIKVKTILDNIQGTDGTTIGKPTPPPPTTSVPVDIRELPPSDMVPGTQP